MKRYELGISNSGISTLSLPCISGVISPVLVATLLLASAFQVSGQSFIAFVPSSVSAFPGFSPEHTYGWGTGPSGNAPQIRITQIGIFDVAGDGLALPHEMAVWVYRPGLSEYQQIYSTTMAAGTAAQLIEGYRFVPIPSFSLAPGEGLLIGALYPQNDPDATLTPSAGHFAPQLFQDAKGGWYPLLGLNPPTQPVCPGMEGEPCARLFPVNFQFEVVPEPSVLALLATGCCGLGLRQRRRINQSRRELAEEPGSSLRRKAGSPSSLP